jgi:hypothetical protein
VEKPKRDRAGENNGNFLALLSQDVKDKFGLIYQELLQPSRLSQNTQVEWGTPGSPIEV